MYTEFFSFKERPFKLVPNPAYLFLGKSHQEAMAHLIYALHEGEGFVEITGEVGTGKTTLCRSFLENLDENTEAAYIFNPNLDSIELLKAINDEFGLNSAADSAKDLIDTLNRFLMAGRVAGKNILLVIDEAQNLSREVLEQIRLLSNLETTQNKLLQIILVGQPELRKMLDSHELRQLRQRVTLSLSLLPLTPVETKRYIEHRLKVGSQGDGQIRFSGGALRMIHRYSAGIPRLINIVCDRVLLTAYGLNQKRISGKITRQAIAELKRDSHSNHAAEGQKWRAACGLLLLAFAVIFAALLTPATLRDLPLKMGKPGTEISEDSVKVKPADPGSRIDVGSPAGSQAANSPKKPDLVHSSPEALAAASSPAVVVPSRVEALVKQVSEEIKEEDQTLPLQEILSDNNVPLTRTGAFQAAMALWDNQAEMIGTTAQLESDHQFFLLASRQSGLMLYSVKNDLELIEKFNLPAIFKFYDLTGGPAHFLVLHRIEGEDYFFTGGNGEPVGRTRAERAEVVSYWTGKAYIPWRNFFSIDGEIPREQPGDSLITLKLLLRDIGYPDIELDPQYDPITRMAVMDVQQRYDLPVDGVVGSMTKIALYNETRDIRIPFLNPEKYGGDKP